MGMVGRVVSVGMAVRPLVVLPVVMSMTVLGDLGPELSVPLRLGLCERHGIVRRGHGGMRHERSQRHRKSDDETQDGSIDAVRHD
jgi:hypothetical protein